MTKLASRSPADLVLSVLCWLLVLLFVAAGAVKFVPVEFERANFIHFGYAMWFMYLIGVVEVAGAALLAYRPTRRFGALLLGATMVGAVPSHLRAGDGFGMASPAFVLLVLLVAVAVMSGPGMRTTIAARLAGRSA